MVSELKDVQILRFDLKLSDRIWTCECGQVLNRDENAAINILNEGLKILTVGTAGIAC